MCGIAAILKNSEIYIPPGTLERMAASISHRGPDDEGTLILSSDSNGKWQSTRETESSWRVALSSRRLSILDISPAGHMPMAYRDRFWCVYNGEVYNFIEIRFELEKLGYRFRSSTDTEVLLGAYAEWGTDCFRRFRGMWGLVIVDCQRNEVIVCRDRLGIKPLYMWQGNSIIALASEIKQFLYVPGFTARVNHEVVDEYLRTGYEDADKSFFRDVQPIPAGTWLTIPLETLLPAPPTGYWHPEYIQASITNAAEAGNLFAAKLQESISLHLRSDVPVGCALSGGLDSSSIAMLVNKLSDHRAPLHTFTSTFPGDASDEREYVEAIVAAIHAVPHYITPAPMTFLQEMDAFLRIHDEPVGSLSIYAGYCIARLTREAGVPVTLNGQGCDEILSGYWQSYFLYLRELARNAAIFPLLEHILGAGIGKGNRTLLTQIPVMLRRYLARRKPTGLVRLRKQHNRMENTSTILRKVLALTEQQLRVEEIRSLYLPRLLKWDDRNSMAFSVEGRYPFLDHELIELCLSFAPAALYHHGWTKWPLRLGLNSILPEKIRLRRSKFGFEVPQDSWLCGPLRPALENWLRQDRPLWQYIERADAQRLADTTWRLDGRQDEQGQALFRLFVFDRWIELFGVKE
ncbi:MAG TPA: asparagine synthase (glutamine-hydrolyzing) [Ktedonobacteraceae bacterium]|nr:asparagine synthase (glutamine-hydrolyzing) [Ktedonobacteraceae bacterium]